MRELRMSEALYVAGGNEWTDVTVDFISNTMATVSIWGHAGELLMMMTVPIEQAIATQERFNNSRR